MEGEGGGEGKEREIFFADSKQQPSLHTVAKLSPEEMWVNGEGRVLCAGLYGNLQAEAKVVWEGG